MKRGAHAEPCPTEEDAVSAAEEAVSRALAEQLVSIAQKAQQATSSAPPVTPCTACKPSASEAATLAHSRA